MAQKVDATFLRAVAAALIGAADTQENAEKLTAAQDLAEKHLAAVSAGLAQAKDELSAAQQQAQQEIATAQKAADDIRAKASADAQASKEASSAYHRRMIDEATAEARKQKDALMQDIEDATGRIASLRVEIASLAKDRDAIRKDVERAKAQYADLQGTISELVARVTTP